MKGKLKRSALMVMLASLSASGMAAAESPAATTTTVAVMSIPAYTLITDSLDSLVPKVNGKVFWSI